MKVRLPDDRELELDGERVTLADVARAIGPGLARAAVAGRIDGVLADLAAPVPDGARVELLTLQSEAGLWVLRHSAAHVLATAVKRLFPEARLGIGPPIQDGFYYDFDLEHRFTEEDLARLEEEMRRVVAEDHPFVREELPRAEALARLRAMGERYKVELVEHDLANEPVVSFYRDGEFVDLCRGPHLPSTGGVRAFKLLHVAGAYWKGRETNPMLQRIYGTAWRDERDLREYLRWREEAQKRDHRRLGRELGLFSFHPEAPGMAFWQPRGTVLFHELLRLYRETHQARGYQEVRTPLVLDVALWHRSGHWENYKENMFFTASEGREFALKPMNCPGHCLLFAEGLRSYRDLPLRLTEPGHVHRAEKSGTLHGLFRVRTFVQDDAHIFCTQEQIESEVVGVIEFLTELYRTLGFDEYRVELSTRPEKSIGSEAVWQAAEAALERAIRAAGMPYRVHPGEGAFYGPKLDFHITDCVGRSWQCGTIQLDFAMPERFGLEYVGADGARHTPVMIHRALFGSLERMIGILTEHFAGAFPLWLAPEQVRVLPIADAHHECAHRVVAQLRAAGLRAEGDFRNLKTGKKVREAALAKVPYVLVIGDRELHSGEVAVRARGNADLGTMTVESLIARLGEEVRTRHTEPVERWRRPTEDSALGEPVY
ncbi:MAG: threonine--tRNA ligase [Planctomycetota bacterium]|nr:MAG: threonine--tRNA ligase [Planctomycetota bacterium]